MSENNLKSAWEIALEKLEAQGEGPIEELSEKIKKKIAETRRKYEALIAEAEISNAGRLKKAVASNQLDQIRSIQEELPMERNKLKAKMEEVVRQIRAGKDKN